MIRDVPPSPAALYVSIALRSVRDTGAVKYRLPLVPLVDTPHAGIGGDCILNRGEVRRVSAGGPGMNHWGGSI